MNPWSFLIELGEVVRTFLILHSQDNVPFWKLTNGACFGLQGANQVKVSTLLLVVDWLFFPHRFDVALIV